MLRILGKEKNYTNIFSPFQGCKMGKHINISYFLVRSHYTYPSEIKGAHGLDLGTFCVIDPVSPAGIGHARRVDSCCANRQQNGEFDQIDHFSSANCAQIHTTVPPR